MLDFFLPAGEEGVGSGVGRVRPKHALWCLFLQGQKLHHEGLIHMTSSKSNYLSKGLSSNIIALGVGLQHMSLGETETFSL